MLGAAVMGGSPIRWCRRTPELSCVAAASPPALRRDPALDALAGSRLGLRRVLAVVLAERRGVSLQRAIGVPAPEVHDRGDEAVAAAGDRRDGAHLDAVLVAPVVHGRSAPAAW